METTRGSRCAFARSTRWSKLRGKHASSPRPPLPRRRRRADCLRNPDGRGGAATAGSAEGHLRRRGDGCLHRRVGHRLGPEPARARLGRCRGAAGRSSSGSGALHPPRDGRDRGLPRARRAGPAIRRLPRALAPEAPLRTGHLQGKAGARAVHVPGLVQSSSGGARPRRRGAHRGLPGAPLPAAGSGRGCRVRAAAGLRGRRRRRGRSTEERDGGAGTRRCPGGACVELLGPDADGGRGRAVRQHRGPGREVRAARRGRGPGRARRLRSEPGVPRAARQPAGGTLADRGAARAPAGWGVRALGDAGVR